MLGLFAFTGAGATALLALVTGTNWRLGVVLFIIATTGYYASVVVYYSVLPEIATPDERDRLSARGWAFGYLGGGFALGLNLATYLGRDTLGLSESAAVRLCFVTAGVWWAAFSFIPLAPDAQVPACARQRARPASVHRWFPSACRHAR
jgi:UMF1 family MFS transporter